MKKYLLFCIFVLACIAVFAAKSDEPIAAQYIVTDCGTVHSIPVNSTEAEACHMVEAWSLVDC